MNSTYWSNQITNLQNNPPKSAGSYYNQSFVDRMNESKANIDNLVAEKDKSWAATNQAQDTYNAFRGDMTSYGDVYKGSKSKFGIEDHQDTYEKSKKALALAESTLEALPSSINSASNRVLTQSQREARYNTLADRTNRYRSNLENKTSMYEEAWKNAREAAATYASETMTGQWSKLDSYNQAWMTSLQNYVDSGDRLTKANLEYMDIQSQYRDWQYNQYSLAYDNWSKNLEAAINARYQATQTEMEWKRTAIANRLTDLDAQMQQIEANKRKIDEGLAKTRAKIFAEEQAVAGWWKLGSNKAGGGGGGGGW